MFALPFDLDIASWTPAGVRRPGAGRRAARRAVVVGANFRFGHRACRRRRLPRAGRRRGRLHRRGRRARRRPQVWSSTYVRTCLAAGDVAGAAEALGRPFAVRGVVVQGDQRGRELGYPTANVPTDGMTAAPADGVYAGRLRRLDTGETPPGRDQRRHQPDLRRRPRPPRRELRPRPHRPRALRRRGRGRVRRAAARHGRLRRHRPAPWSRRWPTTYDRRASSSVPDAPSSAAAAAEAWFQRHGLPYFVDDIRARCAHRLSRARVIAVAGRRPGARRRDRDASGHRHRRVAGPGRGRERRRRRPGPLRAAGPEGIGDRGLGAAPRLRQPGAAVAAGDAGPADAAALHHLPVHQHRGLAGRLRLAGRGALGVGAVLRGRGLGFLVPRLAEELDPSTTPSTPTTSCARPTGPRWPRLPARSSTPTSTCRRRRRSPACRWSTW